MYIYIGCYHLVPLPQPPGALELRLLIIIFEEPIFLFGNFEPVFPLWYYWMLWSFESILCENDKVWRGMGEGNEALTAWLPKSRDSNFRIGFLALDVICPSFRKRSSRVAWGLDCSQCGLSSRLLFSLPLISPGPRVMEPSLHQHGRECYPHPVLYLNFLRSVTGQGREPLGFSLT